MAEIRLESVSKYYKNLLAIDNMNLEVHDKEFFVILGPSGAGKTTTLKMVAGIEPVSKGNIIIDDQIINSIPPEDRNIAMVFESYALYSHLSVFENIAFSFHAPGRKKPAHEIERSVKRTAQILEIDKFLQRRPTELSGGQRQRVALGRALVRNPTVFLMDEPLSHLDAKIRSQMRAELKSLRETINTTIIYVTHDYHEALALGERMAILHDGKIQQIDKPNDVFHNPENIICAESFGDPSINLIEGQIISDNGDLSIQINEFNLPLPKSFIPKLLIQKNEKVLIGIRPSHIVPHKTKPDKNFFIPARVYVQEIVGDEEILTTTLGNYIIKALAKPGIPFDLEETIYLSWNSESIHLFSKETGLNLMK